MSNSNDSKSTQLETHSVGETQNNKSKRWGFIQNDLSKALNTWQELEKSEAQLSPEEEQFKQIKTIIGQLKEKLEKF
jgi:hypothetical protein